MNDKLRKGGWSIESFGVSFSCEDPPIDPLALVFESGNLLPMSGRAIFGPVQTVWTGGSSGLLPTISFNALNDFEGIHLKFIHK